MAFHQVEPRLSQQISLVLALWVMEFTMCFVTKSMGVLLPVFLEQFETRTSDIGVVVSVVMFSGNIIGLSAQALTRLFQERPVLVACGVVTSIGLLVNALASYFVVLIIGMTLTGAMTMGNSVALGTISSFFPKHSDVVANIMLSALPMAYMISAPITQLLLDMYGWRSTLMIINALFCHNIAAAVYLKPLKSNVGNDYSSIPSNSVQVIDIEDKQSERNCNIFKDVLNISLLRSISFQVVLVLSFVTGLISNGWVVYLVSVAQSKGLSPTSAANVVIVSGIGAFVMRIVLAVLTWKGILSNYKLLFLISSALLMMSFGGLSVVSSFWTVSVFSFLLGFGYGILGSQIVIAVNKSVGEDDIVSAYSWAHIVGSVGYLMSGYFSGLLYDLTGSFFMTAIMQCVVSFLIPVSFAAEYLWTSCQR